MLDAGGRARLLHVAIWLATLFFTAMLFVPLLREVLRREAVLMRDADLPAAVRRWLLDCLATPSEFTPDQRFFLR